MLTETLKALEEHAAQYKQYKHMAGEAEKLANEHRDAIKKLLNGEPQTILVEGYKISWTVFNQSRLDQKALQREMPGIYAMYQKPSTADRLTVN